MSEQATSAHRPRPGARGFTLIEVMVALVIVAFGLGALLSTLSASASNLSALREKTLAHWIALNLIADTRLAPQAPSTGTTEGEVTNFAAGNWHFRREVTPVREIPGMMQILLRVRRSTLTRPPSAAGTASSANSPDSGSSRNGLGTAGSLAGPAMLGGGTASLGGVSGTGTALVTVTVTSSSATVSESSDKDGNWIATAIGFRGDALSAASGEAPDWNGTANTGGTDGSTTGGATIGTGGTKGSGNSGPQSSTVGGAGSGG